MSRGIQASVFLICMTLAVTFMASVGAYSAVDAGSYSTQATSDVNRIVEAVEQPESPGGGPAALDPILGLTVGALNTMQVFWVIVSDTSELFVLYGAPIELANQLETLVRVALGLTFVYLARGVVL